MSAANARLAWTSVPRWAAPALPAAASYLACWFGDEAGRRAQALLAGADPAVPIAAAGFAARWDAQTETELRRLIDGCRTGVRIILAGPESVVLQAIALVKALGATAEEIVSIATEAASDASDASDVYVSGVAARRVFCAACRRSFDAVAAIGGHVACPGCAAELIVDYRFSGPHAAYFGWPTGLDLHR